MVPDQPLFAATTVVAAVSPGVSPGNSSSIDVVLWAGILMVAVIGGGMVIMYLRRRLLEKDGGAAGGGLMLDDLRRMHQRGELSADEFQAAKDAITSRLSGKPAPPRPAPIARSSTDGTMVSPPGFDLLGRPLPKPASGAGAGGGPRGAAPPPPPRRAGDPDGGAPGDPAGGRR